jgi:hypothetical protein
MPEYVNPVLAGHRLLICPVCRGNAPPEGHVGCCLDDKRPEPVPYVPATGYDFVSRQRDEALAEAAKWEGLARRLYALMGDEAERLMPGGLDA